jgi:phage shock protein B
MDVLPIIFISAIVPLWLILHYVTKWKSTKVITADDETLLIDLRGSAEKLEQRLHVMERILDDEVPDWRARFNDPL